VIHREYGNHQRKLDSTESGLGVITLVAVTLIAVQFADPKTASDRMLAIALGLAAWAGSVGLMLFRGYDPFYTVSFQRDYRENPSAALRKYVDEMTEAHEVSERAFRAKRVCAWISAGLIAVVEIAVSVSRWRGARGRLAPRRVGVLRFSEGNTMKRLLNGIWYIVRLAFSDPGLVEKLDHSPTDPATSGIRIKRR
jgi:hypothetical protein